MLSLIPETQEARVTGCQSLKKEEEDTGFHVLWPANKADRMRNTVIMPMCPSGSGMMVLFLKHFLTS